MTVSVEKERYLGVACGDGEQIVFDRNRDEFHLLRGLAAQIWEIVGFGGTFPFSEIALPEKVSTEEFVTALREMEKAELVSVDSEAEAKPNEAGETKIDRRAWISLTGKAAAVATVLPLVMTLAAPKPGLAHPKKKPFHPGGDGGDESKGNGDHHDVSPFCKDDESKKDESCSVDDGHDGGDESKKDESNKDENWWDNDDESKKDESNNNNNNWWDNENNESNRDESNRNNNNNNNWWDND